MWAPDVNVLVDAFREDAPAHRRVRRWLEARLATAEPMALFDAVLTGFLRVVTHPRVFDPPTPAADALAFVRSLRAQPNAVAVAPEGRHWPIFERLYEVSDARGNLVTDAYLAALAIEAGCLWVTSDHDFSRFPGLRWETPGS